MKRDLKHKTEEAQLTALIAGISPDKIRSLIDEICHQTPPAPSDTRDVA